MFYNNYGDFPYPSYFGYNSAEQEKPCFTYFYVSGLFRTQIDLRFFGRQYFTMRSIRSTIS
jgi:hypothetical protein